MTSLGVHGHFDLSSSAREQLVEGEEERSRWNALPSEERIDLSLDSVSRETTNMNDTRLETGGERMDVQTSTKGDDGP